MCAGGEGHCPSLFFYLHNHEETGDLYWKTNAQIKC